MKYVRKVGLLFLCIMTISLAACGGNGNDYMGDTVNDATDGTNGATDGDGNTVERGLQDMGDGIRDAADTAGEEIQDMTDGMDDNHTSQNRKNDRKQNDNQERR